MQEIKNVCVVGAGVMGQQIAFNSALHGYETKLTDSFADALGKAKKWAEGYTAGRIAKGKMTEEAGRIVLGKLQFVGDLQTAAGDADLVIEAIIEKVDVKRELFAKLDKIAPKHAILATNSSTIVSSALASSTSRPGKVANFHYFNPALVMQLIEVVKGPHTSDETAEALMGFARKSGKTPVLIRKEIDGFIVNRILGVVLDEALYLLDQGVASPEEIDIAVEKGLNYPIGPFRLQDMTGIDLSYLIKQRHYEETGLEKYLPTEALKQKYLAGEYGRKTGKGWYDYSQEKK
jgi:3-hydroxybutyryl-CoA dehydrogenase